MGMLDGSNDPRAAREAMEQAANRSRRTFGEGDADGNAKPKRPQRYKLYDRIADKVSLNAINAIIAVTALLLVAVLIYGIATGNPQ